MYKKPPVVFSNAIVIHPDQQRIALKNPASASIQIFKKNNKHRRGIMYK